MGSGQARRRRHFTVVRIRYRSLLRTAGECAGFLTSGSGIGSSRRRQRDCGYLESKCCIAGCRVREPLKYSPIHRLSGYCVSRRENTSATADSGSTGEFREVRAEVQAGTVSRPDGASGAVGGVTSLDRAALSERGERAASGGFVDHAAGVLSAAVVQSERSWGRGGAV